MNIIFLSGGARQMALKSILDNGENVTTVITPRLTENNKRHSAVIKIAEEYGIQVLQIEKKETDEVLRSLEYDLLVSCGFPYIINTEVIKDNIAINVHPTLLPKYRGFRSGAHIIINGEKKSGVTIHYLTEKMDKGDILAQKEFPLTQFDTTRSMMRKSQMIEGELLVSVISMIRKGQFGSTPQDESEATTYKNIRTPKDSEINWQKPLKELYNEIRACDPIEYPAFFYVNGEKVCIKLWRPEKGANEKDMI